ncbi:hypothetical protein [uncultured Nocardioides sp.]|uniref:hypothetical protein n=1 Tax=uncultured Nocardioides sp. TaxID=198441 RepID=UPI002639B5FE|nr:hypothetical protein [uncultured Nocardioides sp.]
MMVKSCWTLTARALSLVLVLLLAGCAQDERSTDNTTPIEIAVTIEGGDVTPSGERIDVKRGQPIEFDVTADTSGQLHVHSDPAQSFDYEPGTSTFRLTPIELPGVVEVEEEDLGQTIVQLEIR